MQTEPWLLLTYLPERTWLFGIVCDDVQFCFAKVRCSVVSSTSCQSWLYKIKNSYLLIHMDIQIYSF